MNILLMSGSPKKNGSASKTILMGLGQYIKDKVAQKVPGSVIINCHALDADVAEKVAACDALVLAFPLYVDGIPSHLLTIMEKLERAAVISPNTRIYTIVNCGFYEGEHSEPALEMAKHWCDRCGAVWGGGLGFGGGGGLDMMESVPMGYGPKKSLGKELQRIADDIFGGTGIGCSYACVDFPALLYKLGGQSGWVAMAKANGLKRKDLSKRL